MKVTLTSKGWDEVSVSRIEITSIPYEHTLHSVKGWLDFNKRHPKIGRKRKTCNCCKKSWKKLNGSVNLIFTNKGNKAVCDSCLQKIKESWLEK